MKNIIVLVVISLIFTSCRSKWSCKKKYVNNNIELLDNKYNS